MGKKIVLARKLEQKSKETSEALKRFFTGKGLFVIDIIGSPGAGKTSLLEGLAPRLQGRAAVIEGDLQTDKDRERIERSGLAACQINTLGACHLDAQMVRDAADELNFDGLEFLFIENVGNLVCPASFEVGEDLKIAVISVTEGDDKPAKYPSAIRKSSAMVVTKTDLLPYIECSVETMERDARETNPEIACFRACAQSGEGLDAFSEWLFEKARLKKEQA
jgi:hydrogenase nickel incorporation protein HypB